MPVTARDKGNVRRSQLVTTYGVGAVVAAGDESFMIAGLDRWTVGAPDVHEPRLERQLGVRGFVLPPSSEGGRGDIPVVRFPSMCSCPTCRRLDRHRFFTHLTDNKCNACGSLLVPSRFVVACNKGHIDDFPFFEWVHKGVRQSSEPKHHVLSIKAGGASASLRDILIECACGLSSTMQGAFGREALKSIKPCTGRRPWLGNREDCAETPRTMQRGASNVYFAVVKSALSIPPWSEGAFKAINQHWRVLKSIPESALAQTIAGIGIANGTEYSVDELVRAVIERKVREGGPAEVGDDTTLREQEYEALTRGRAESSKKQDFVCVPPGGADAAVDVWFEQVMLVTKLREVRALQSFTRLLPPSPGDPPERRAPLASEVLEWLPAIDVLGEGVFLRLSGSRLILQPHLTGRRNRGRLQGGTINRSW